MSSLDHAGDAVDLVATAVNAVGLVEYGVFVEDLVDRFASAHGINLSEHVMEVAKQTRSIQCRTWFFSDWCQAAVALPPRSSRPRFCCFALVATWHNASFKAGRECRSLAPFDRRVLTVTPEIWICCSSRTSRNRRRLNQMRLRRSGPFRSEPADHDAVAPAAFNAAVHHSRSSIMVLAAPSSSVRPASTSPPWKCAQSVATGIWTDERTGAS